MPDLIPDIAELEAIEAQLIAANRSLTPFSEQLEQFTQSYSQIKAVTQNFSRGDISIVTQHMPTPEGNAIESITTFTEQLCKDATDLDERVENILNIIDEPLSEFNEYVNTTQQTIDAIGDWAQTLTDAVDSVLVEKSDVIKQSTEALSEIRQDKLEQGQDWVYQEVQNIIAKVMQDLLGDISEKLEQYTKTYQQTIGRTNEHVEDLNKQVENSVGQVTDQLQKVTDILEQIKPILKTAEVILA